MDNKVKYFNKLLAVVNEYPVKDKEFTLNTSRLAEKNKNLFGTRQNVDKFLKEHLVKDGLLTRTNKEVIVKKANTYKWNTDIVCNTIMNLFNTTILNVLPASCPRPHTVQLNQEFFNVGIKNELMEWFDYLYESGEAVKWTHENLDLFIRLESFIRTDCASDLYLIRNTKSGIVGATNYPDRPLYCCRRKFTENEVLTGLNYSYPWLYEYWEAMDAYNRKLMQEHKSKDRLVCFKPNVNYEKHAELIRGKKVIVDNGRVYKVGMRMFSDVCSVEKGLRESYIKENWNWEKVFEYDVNGSIHRLTRALCKGAVDESDYDVYELFANKKLSNRKDIVGDSERSLWKLLAMRIYFAPSARYAANKINKPWTAWKAEEEYEDYLARKEANEWKMGKLRALCFDGECTEEKVQVIKDRMEKYYGGKSLRNEIFMYESMLMFNALEILEENGVEACCVYDCLLTEYEIDFNAVLREAFKRMLRDIK